MMVSKKIYSKKAQPGSRVGMCEGDCACGGNCTCKTSKRNKSSIYWGGAFIVVGGWLIAQQLGIVSIGFSFWPILVLVLGIWIYHKSRSS